MDTVYLAMVYDRRADNYRLQPQAQMGHRPQPDTDPAVGEVFTVYGRWNGRAARNAQRYYGRRVEVWLRWAHPVTGAFSWMCVS